MRTLMCIGKFALAAGSGAVAGFSAEQLGYDISMLEGARQAALAYLPVLALFEKDHQIDGIFREDYNKLETAADIPYLFPVISAAVGAGLFYLGGVAMEYFTKTGIDEKFAAVAGGIGGLVEGVGWSIKGRCYGSEVDNT